MLGPCSTAPTAPSSVASVPLEGSRARPSLETRGLASSSASGSSTSPPPAWVRHKCACALGVAATRDGTGQRAINQHLPSSVALPPAAAEAALACASPLREMRHEGGRSESSSDSLSPGGTARNRMGSRGSGGLDAYLRCEHGEERVTLQEVVQCPRSHANPPPAVHSIHSTQFQPPSCALH